MIECPICDSTATGDFVCDKCKRVVCETCFSFTPEQDEGGLCIECATPTPLQGQLEDIATQLSNIALTNRQTQRSKSLQLNLLRLAEHLRGIAKQL